MVKNLLFRNCINTLVLRAQKLEPQSVPLWGTMTVTEMLLHCNKINEQLLTATPKKSSTSIQQYVARLLVLYILPNLPKGAKAPKHVITKGQADSTDFASQQQQFIALLQRFPQHHLPIVLPHPYFGALSTKQWGLAGYKHVDHHLRQFGV